MRASGPDQIGVDPATATSLAHVARVRDLRAQVRSVALAVDELWADAVGDVGTEVFALELTVACHAVHLAVVALDDVADAVDDWPASA